MKKQKIRFLQIIAGLIILAMVTPSCEDFLEEVPGDKISPEQHYKASVDSEISKLGAFSILQEVVPNLIILDGLRSDMMAETGNFDPDLKELNQHNISLGNKYNDPSPFYRIIINANEVLKNIKKIKDHDKEYDDNSYFLDVTDLVSLRSWAYFTLVRLYGEAAYIPDNMASYNEGYPFEYFSKDRMIDTLLSQLDTLTYPNALAGLNPVAIYDRALRGDLYLEKGDYEKAITHLENAIGFADIKIFKVDRYAKEDWKTIHINAISQFAEVMSVVPFSYEDKQENPLANLMYANGDYLVKPSSYIVGLFQGQLTKRDEVGDLYRGEGISYSYFGPEKILMVNKYGIDPVENSGSDIIIYRAADIQLLLAEALNRYGDHENALNIVNGGYRTLPGWKSSAGIRGRAYLKNREITDGDITNVIEDIIMEERAMELAFEGKRWFDLVRVANRRGESYLADKVSAKFQDPAIAENVRNKLLDKSKWYLPFRK